jgi:outer membrane scaffolding protein for murein synthesis (MipA/OmpV family)
MPEFRLRSCAAVLLAAAAASPAWGQADPLPTEPAPPPGDAGRPRWELGVAAGGGHVADYPGSDESRARGLVAPVVIYRGPVLRVEGSSIRGRVFDSPHWELDLSASGAFNARNNAARRGMPELDWLFGLGPQLVYKGWRKDGRGPTLHLKTRAIFSTDFGRVDSRGAAFDPELRWRLRPRPHSPATLTLFVQPTWATRTLHRYFYEVTPAEALATRPAYAARSGYLGTEFGATWFRRHDDRLSYFVTARALSLHGAANDGSPLLRDKTNLSVGAGLIWTPWQSATRVSE